jgi:hypothetical protein
MFEAEISPTRKVWDHPSNGRDGHFSTAKSGLGISCMIKGLILIDGLRKKFVGANADFAFMTETTENGFKLKMN